MENFKRVLVADDDKEMRSLVVDALTNLKVKVVEAASGVALLSFLAAEPDFDLIVTDVRMPWLSGVQVVQMARAAGYGVPFLVMTAFAEEGLRASIRRVLDTSLIEKPFDMRDFVARAGQMLGLGESEYGTVALKVV